ncbi:MAG: chitobiase/beta-hexosaminidase C-terminal domain-containing protein [Candidatus Krumholzibacteria bacterium]|nr:chitobiase/beta-hexosaminidase C-terminal domain-containing protein [Candidatus Krumholzibacteria bacterium]
MRSAIILCAAAVLVLSPGCSDDESTAGPDKQTVATPVLDPAGGAYSVIQHLKMTCSTADASICYTTDGTDPDESSALFATGDSIEVGVTSTIKARAYKTGMNPSEIAQETYLIDLEDVATPYFEPEGGVYHAPLDAIIHCATAFARIFYTTDGSDPDTNSTEFIFQTVIPVDATTTLRARAYKEGMDPGETAEATFTIIPGLVAYYPFEGNAEDGSGNGHHGTAYGAVYVADRFGIPDAACQFDGTDDYVELPDESAFDFTEFTVSFWTRITTLPVVGGPSTPGYYCVVNKGANFGNYTVRLSKTGGATYCNLSYTHQTSGGNWVMGCYENVYLNQYRHIVVTLSDEVRCYFDGALSCTSTGMTAPLLNNGAVLIGKNDSVTNPWHFNGIVDDVRFYNRALSDAEIADLYEAED